MSSPLGIVASPPEKHNLCSTCSSFQISGHGCLVRHCPSCNGPLRFTTRICLKCSKTKSVCQVCETPLPVVCETPLPVVCETPPSATDATGDATGKPDAPKS